MSDCSFVLEISLRNLKEALYRGSSGLPFHNGSNSIVQICVCVCVHTSCTYTHQALLCTLLLKLLPNIKGKSPLSSKAQSCPKLHTLYCSCLMFSLPSWGPIMALRLFYSNKPHFWGELRVCSLCELTAAIFFLLYLANGNSYLTQK